MPRNPRLFVPRATYHVYCRVARGEYVFDSDEEAIGWVPRTHLLKWLVGGGGPRGLGVAWGRGLPGGWLAIGGSIAGL
jgi:hypothetical protein